VCVCVYVCVCEYVCASVRVYLSVARQFADVRIQCVCVRVEV